MQINKENIILELKNVSYTYDTKVILDDISLSIERGEYLAIIGPNGAGKTTLLKLMLGLLSPTSGTLCLCGEDCCTFTQRHRVGYIPQRASKKGSSFPATVYEAVAMGRYKAGGICKSLTEEDRNVINESIAEMGMTEYKDTLLENLSGGQEQRVFIARALVNNPEILFLDEPMIGVDKETQEEFYKILQKLNKERNITIILISHDIERMQKEANTILSIDGCVRFYDKASLFTDTACEGDDCICIHHHE